MSFFATPSPERERAIVSYEYLCRRGARKFLRCGLERSDLEQVAAIGLIKAADRYDVTMRTPFEAFAWIMIVGELMHYVRDYERLVRIPRRLFALERRYLTATETLTGALGRAPTDREVAAATGVLPATVAELRCAREASQPACLDDPAVAAGPREPLYADQSGSPVEDRILLEMALASLSLLERRIVVGLYLLGMSQLELARRLGISPKCVSRLHGVALGRMQQACGAAG
ncbi:MAG: sigma-70 family RNA polymerase sigma factor [Vulcanimicrobiaceae bacterium]